MMKQPLMFFLFAVYLVAGKPAANEDENFFFVKFEVKGSKPSTLTPGVNFDVDTDVDSIEIECVTNATDPLFTLTKSFEHEIYQNYSVFQIEKSNQQSGNEQREAYKVSFQHLLEDVKVFLTCSIRSKSGITKSRKVSIVIKAGMPNELKMNTIPPSKQNPPEMITRNYNDEPLVVLNCTTDVAGGKFSLEASGKTDLTKVSVNIIQAGNNSLWSTFNVTYIPTITNVDLIMTCSLKNSTSILKSVGVSLDIEAAQADAAMSFSFDPKGMYHRVSQNGYLSLPPHNYKGVFFNCSTNEKGRFIELDVKHVIPKPPRGGVDKISPYSKNDYSSVFNVTYYSQTFDIEVNASCVIYDNDKPSKNLITSTSAKIVLETLRVSMAIYKYNEANETVLMKKGDVLQLNYFSNVRQNFIINCTTNWTNGNLKMSYKSYGIDLLSYDVVAKNNFSTIFNIPYSTPDRNGEVNFTCFFRDSYLYTELNSVWGIAVAKVPKLSIKFFAIRGDQQSLLTDGQYLYLDIDGTEQVLHLNCTSNVTGPYLKLSMGFFDVHDEIEGAKLTVKNETDKDNGNWAAFHVNYTRISQKIHVYMYCYAYNRPVDSFSIDKTWFIAVIYPRKPSIKMYRIKHGINELMENEEIVKVSSNLKRRELQFNCTTTVAGKILKLQQRFTSEDDKKEAGIVIKQDRTGVFWASFNVMYNKTKHDIDAEVACHYYEKEDGDSLISSGIILSIGLATVQVNMTEGRWDTKLKNEQDLFIDQTAANIFQIKCISNTKVGRLTLNHTYFYDEDKAEANVEIKLIQNGTYHSQYDVTYKNVSYEVKGNLSCFHHKEESGDISVETLVHTVFKSSPPNLTLYYNEDHLKEGADFILNRTQMTSFHAACRTNFTKKFITLNTSLSSTDKLKIGFMMREITKTDTFINYTVAYQKTSPELSFNLICEQYTKENGHVINSTYIVAHIVEEVQDIAMYRIDGSESLISNESNIEIDGRTEGSLVLSCNTNKKNRQLGIKVFSTESQLKTDLLGRTNTSALWKVSYPRVYIPTIVEVNCTVEKGYNAIMLNATTVKALIRGNSVEMEMYQGKTLLNAGEDIIIMKGITMIEVTCSSNASKEVFALESSLPPKDEQIIGLSILPSKSTDKSAVYTVIFGTTLPKLSFNLTCKQFDKSSGVLLNTTYAVANIIDPIQDISLTWIDPMTNNVISDESNHTVAGERAGAIALNFTTTRDYRKFKLGVSINNDLAGNFKTQVNETLSDKAMTVHITFRPEVFDQTINITASLYTNNSATGGKLLNESHAVLIIGKAIPMIDLFINKTLLKKGEVIKLGKDKKGSLNFTCETNFEGRNINMTVIPDKIDKNGIVAVRKIGNGTTWTDFTVEYDQSTFKKNVSLTCMLCNSDVSSVLNSTTVSLSPNMSSLPDDGQCGKRFSFVFYMKIKYD